MGGAIFKKTHNLIRGMSSKKEEKLRRKHEKSVASKPAAEAGAAASKTPRETRKLSDLKNPSNMTVDERREDELGLRKRARERERSQRPQIVSILIS